MLTSRWTQCRKEKGREVRVREEKSVDECMVRRRRNKHTPLMREDRKEEYIFFIFCTCNKTQNYVVMML